MRIAVVSPYDLGATGGVQDQVVKLTGWLHAAGHDAVAVGPGTDGPADAVLTGASVRVTANRSTAPIALDPRAIARVRRALAGFDVIHVHEPFMPAIGPAALGASGAATVATFHADPSATVRRLYSLGAPLARRLLRSVGVVTAVSPVAAEALRPISPVRIIPNGIDVAAYGHGKRVQGRVAFLGRDDPRKGLDVLLSAWPGVLTAAPHASLSVIGAARSEVIDGVTWHGRVTEQAKRRLLAEAEILAAPNTGGESFGIIVVEGMASGCAVVASAIPAFVDVVADGAELVAPGDPGGLAERLVLLLSDDGRRRAIAEAGTARAGAFDGGSVAAEYLLAYEEATRGATGAAG